MFRFAPGEKLAGTLGDNEIFFLRVSNPTFSGSDVVPVVLSERNAKVTKNFGVNFCAGAVSCFEIIRHWVVDGENLVPSREDKTKPNNHDY